LFRFVTMHAFDSRADLDSKTTRTQSQSHGKYLIQAYWTMWLHLTLIPALIP